MGIHGRQRFSLGRTWQILISEARGNRILWAADLDMATICALAATTPLNLGVMFLCHGFPAIVKKVACDCGDRQILLRIGLKYG
jgi:hypothetical protein